MQTRQFNYQSGEVDLDLTHVGNLSFASFAPQDVNFSTSQVSVGIPSADVLRLNLTFTASTSISLAAHASKTLGTFTLHGTDVCISSIYFFNALLNNGSQDCVPTHVSTEIGNMDEDALCLQSFSIGIETQYGTSTFPAGSGVEGVNFEVSATSCLVSGITNTNGTASGCISCTTPGLSHTVKPSKINNPLNGVSTYDLVLISRHTLGLEPLDNP